jgi:uncharacterized protein (UPF0216 family)
MAMARDGTKLLIDREELKRVSDMVPKTLHGRLHLPIVLIRRIDLGQGVFTISGEKIEAFFVAKILETTNESFMNYETASIQDHLYRPQVQELRRKLRTLSVIGFGGATPSKDDFASIDSSYRVLHVN